MPTVRSEIGPYQSDPNPGEATPSQLFVAGVVVCWGAEAGNPIVHKLGVDAAGGNMEGKPISFPPRA
jgi:K+-transporting ATPase A subunit